MRGIVFLGNRKLEIQEFPDPAPGPGEVVLEMKASGMCGSDLHPYRAAGNAAAALGLGAGGPGMTGHGGHAPFMLAPAFTCVPLPDELTFEEGAAVSCGTGTAYGALKRLDVSGRDTLAVFGQGPVGLSATMLGRAMGARVIAVDVSPERLALARELGAEHTIDPRASDPVKAIHDLTAGEGADTTMDCSGHPDARAQAVRSAGTWGRVAFVGEGNTVTLDVSKDLLRRQITLHASWTFSNVGQEECARFIAERKVPLGRLLTHRWRLD